LKCPNPPTLIISGDGILNPEVIKKEGNNAEVIMFIALPIKTPLSPTDA